MKYAYVEDKKIIKIEECPISYKNVSNFYLLPDKDKITYGWYPIEEIKPTLNDWQEYSGTTKVLEETKVILTNVVKDQTIDAYRDRKLNILDGNTSFAIENQAPAYQQRNAALGIYETEKSSDIKKVITDFRGVCCIKEESLKKALTYKDIEAVDIQVE